jgi:hypothetical protein
MRGDDAEWNGWTRNSERGAAGAQRTRNMAKDHPGNVRHTRRAPERHGKAMNSGRGIRCNAVEIRDEAADVWRSRKRHGSAF